MVIYRPPSSGRNRETINTFIDELSTLLEVLIITRQKLLRVGDFNLHVDDPHHADVQRFLSLLDMSELCNHVQGPTHTSGHTLDLVISRRYDDLVSDVSTDESLPSDHRCITCRLSIARPPPAKRSATFSNNFSRTLNNHLFSQTHRRGVMT